MQSLLISKKEFLGLLSVFERQQPRLPFLRTRDISQPPPPGELWAIWAEDESEKFDLPTALVVDDADLSEFLAMSVTFAGTFSPISSFFHIVPWSVFRLMQPCGEWRPSAGVLSSAFVGAIRGEAMAETRGRTRDAISLRNLASTLSYSAARVLVLYGRSSMMDLLFQRWSEARLLTGQGRRFISLEALEVIWDTLAQVSQPREDVKSPLLVRACLEIQRYGVVSAGVWESLAGRLMDYDVIHRDMTQRKEKRIRVFERFLHSQSSEYDDPIHRAFVSGYIACLVSGGSWSHADLLLPLLEELPTVLIWYGICVGLCPQSTLLADGGGIGHHIVRELLRPHSILSRPHFDMSCDELKVRLNSANGLGPFVRWNSNLLSLELLPGVNSWVVWPPKDSDELDERRIYSRQAYESFAQFGLDLERLRERYRAMLNKVASLESAESSYPNRQIKRRPRS